MFHKLNKEDAAKVCDLFLNVLSERLKKRDIELTVTSAAKDLLLGEGYDETYGARPLKRVIQRRIEDALSEEILAGRVHTGQKVEVDAREGSLAFRPVK